MPLEAGVMMATAGGVRSFTVKDAFVMFFVVPWYTDRRTAVSVFYP
jgi:hypothetical protein